MKILSNSVVMSIMAVGIMMGTAGCATQGGGYENAEYRADRAAEVAAHDSFFDCQQSAISLSKQAARPALYHSSATLALRCISDLADNRDAVSRNERMQLHALAIVNFAKSGEIAVAQSELKNFKQQYAFYDLYLDDGASFIDTMNLMLGEVPPRLAADNSLSNASTALKRELRRQQYWKIN